MCLWLYGFVGLSRVCVTCGLLIVYVFAYIVKPEVGFYADVIALVLCWALCCFSCLLPFEIDVAHGDGHKRRSNRPLLVRVIKALPVPFQNFVIIWIVGTRLVMVKAKE